MDATDQEQEQRRKRLRDWIKANGGHAAVVDKRRLSPSQASYLSQVTNGYSFAARAARNMEARLGLPLRSLEPDAPIPAAVAEPGGLSAGLAAVLDAVAALSQTRWVSVRAQLDQLAGRPELKDDVIEELQVLLRPAPRKRDQEAA